MPAAAISRNSVILSNAEKAEKRNEFTNAHEWTRIRGVVVHEATRRDTKKRKRRRALL
jgi:hypothetical protein